MNKAKNFQLFQHFSFIVIQVGNVFAFCAKNKKAPTLHICQVTKTEKLPCKAELLQIKGRNYTKL